MGLYEVPLYMFLLGFLMKTMLASFQIILCCYLEQF